MLESAGSWVSYILVHQAGLADPTVSKDDNLRLLSICLY